MYTVRDGGKLVGFAAYFVFDGLHAENSKGAVSDAFGVIPEYRRPGVAMRLLRFAESELRGEGVNVMHTQTNNAFPGGGRLLNHLGHHAISQTHAKVSA